VDSVIAILEKFSWPLATAVVVVILAIIFRRQLADLVARTTSIEIDPKRRKWQFKFGEQVRREQKKATMIPRHVTAPTPVPPPLVASSGAQLTGRDMVIDAWGAVKQAVFDGCIANRIHVTPTLSVPEARRRLTETRKLSADLVGLVDLVYELGREVASDSRLRPQEEDAKAYRTLAYSAAYWLAESVLVPSEALAPAPERRATMVGANVAPSSPGSFGAVLVAVGGPMKGQRYVIDKPNYRMGRNPNNDLCAAADDSVSSNHASLRYENGGLFLYDQGSLNGTFVNEQRVSTSPLIVRRGDRIRMGESVFEVTGAAPDSRSGTAKEGSSKRPSDPTKVL
jgi:hypothetical protein